MCEPGRQDQEETIRCFDCNKEIKPGQNFECLNKIAGATCNNPMCHPCWKKNNEICPACQASQ